MTRFEPRTQRKWIVSLLLIIFLVPFFLAWFVYETKVFHIDTLNYGQLILPPKSIDTLIFTASNNEPYQNQLLKGRWLLIYAMHGTCGKNCRGHLYDMRQLHFALGKNQNRLQEIVLTDQLNTDTTLNRYLMQNFRGTLHLKTKFSDLANLLHNASINVEQEQFYLIDPLGNLMMYYPKNQKPKNILKDLKRLLAVSSIG